ncbi:Spo0B C-terminal domain-containing protein [Bacillus sp. T33-2]|uniref:Spo0B C-terminal domain-containing protein n=1 Tax=Bacillus sp. T33-2 TaxID=2054168 RepID=UPI000C758CFA|nr:Spo0B C-terminal domain-containing protein [Bacillus sp. T33-2]PLR93728.1 sporulation protein [Bacillus sp. T33-2]
MDKKWDTIEVLRHARHDWLNKLQLIKMNLSMDRPEKVHEIIDQIVMESQQETRLSNLKLPRFASLLLTCNWEKHLFKLDYEVIESSHTNHVDDELLAKWTNDLFLAVDQCIEPFQENYLSVTIQPEEAGIRFFFDFKGIITDNVHLKRFLGNPDSALTVQVTCLKEDELSIEVFLLPG